MKLNVELLLVLLIVGAAVDWILQWQWQAMNKSKWNGKRWGGECALQRKRSWAALLTHCLTFAFVTTTAVAFLVPGFYGTHAMTQCFYGLFLSHILIDNRYPVKWILRMKGLSWGEIEGPDYGYLHIGVDQRLHELAALILAFIL
jgi:ABC-type Fe3+ transport system permease subunit